MEAYISADIEADGPIPGPYSMLSLGMCIAGEQDASGTFRPIQPESARFYRELKPISDRSSRVRSTRSRAAASTASG